MEATRLPEEEKATVTREPLLEAVGTHIGPYKLVQQLGEGGMGAVFVADQSAPVKRRVALKVIKPGMDERLARQAPEAIGTRTAGLSTINKDRLGCWIDCLNLQRRQAVDELAAQVQPAELAAWPGRNLPLLDQGPIVFIFWPLTL